MKDSFCTYDGQRDAALVAYLYDEIDPLERQAFEHHLAACLACRTELHALSDVREGLAVWPAPAVADGVGGQSPRVPIRLVDTPPRAGAWRTISEAPLWMQAAAAMLIVAASLGLANINLTYSRDGLSVSTGWMRTGPVPVSAPPAQVVAAQPDPAPWRAEMTALESKLLQDLKAHPATIATATDDEALVKRVHALIQESERRQQRELALRVAEVARDGQAQRQADLVRIDRTLGVIQNRTGVEVMRTQQQLNSLAQRVSQRQ